MSDSKAVLRTVNNSIGKSNYSQRKNPDDPSTPWNETAETCNVTAAVTALEAAGWNLAKLNKGLHDRSAMDLLFFMRLNKSCLNEYSRIDPRRSVPMNEWMDILAIAVREYTGDQRIRCIYGMRRSEILDEISRGGTGIIHGDFQFVRSNGGWVKGGHYEALVGYQAQGADVIAWIVDDPYGDPHSGYISQYGNDIIMMNVDVDTMIKPIGTGGKDVILIPRPVS
jgi:hypothetical protein